MSLGPDLPPIGHIPGLSPDQISAARRATAHKAITEGWPLNEVHDVMQALGFIDTVPGGKSTPCGDRRRVRPSRRRVEDPT